MAASNATAQEEYDKIYRQLLTEAGRAEIGDDILRTKRMEEKIQEFLDIYPTTVASNQRADTTTPWIKLTVQEVYRRCLQTAIDIIKDISDVITNRDVMGNVAIRRRIVQIFTLPERRIYVGIWLIFLSFVVYFIDSAA